MGQILVRSRAVSCKGYTETKEAGEKTEIISSWSCPIDSVHCRTRMMISNTYGAVGKKSLMIQTSRYWDQHAGLGKNAGSVRTAGN